MPVLRSFVVIAALTHLVGSESPLLGQVVKSSDSRHSLSGIEAVQVQAVITVDGDAGEVSPDGESVQSFIEALLDEADVRSQASLDRSSRIAYLELEVGISTLIVGESPLGWAYVLNLQVLQEVCIERLPRPAGCSVVPTWGTGTSKPTIVASDLTMILYGQVAEAVRRFLHDYLEVNPA